MKYRLQITEITHNIHPVGYPGMITAMCSDPYTMPMSGGVQFINLEPGQQIKVGDWVDFDYTDGKGLTWKLVENKS